MCSVWDSSICDYVDGHFECPEGWYWSEAICDCVVSCEPFLPDPGMCYSWDPGVCDYVHVSTECPNGSRWDEGECSCVSDCHPPPDPGPCYSLDPGSCEYIHVPTDCELGKYWDEDHCACEPYCEPDYSPPGACYQWDHALCEWVPLATDCPEGQKWNEASCSCEPLCSPTEPDPGACFYWDDALCDYTHVPTDCPTGHHWDEGECRCIADCEQTPQPNPCSQWNAELCQWENPNTNCPLGFYWSEDICGCVPNCEPAGTPPSACYIWDYQLCDWVPDPKQCPLGKHWDDDECKCVCDTPPPSEIPEGLHWSEESCRLECDAGVTNGLCCAGALLEDLAKMGKACCDWWVSAPETQTGIKQEGIPYTVGEQCCSAEGKKVYEDGSTAPSGTRALKWEGDGTGWGLIDGAVGVLKSAFQEVNINGFGAEVTGSVELSGSVTAVPCCHDGAIADSGFVGITPFPGPNSDWKATAGIALKARVSIPAGPWSSSGNWDHLPSPLGKLKLKYKYGVSEFWKGACPGILEQWRRVKKKCAGPLSGRAARLKADCRQW